MKRPIVNLVTKEAMERARLAYLSEKDTQKRAELKREYRKARNLHWWDYDKTFNVRGK